MPTYGLYILKADGRYDHLVQRFCQNDDEAIEFARSIPLPHGGVEVWCGERKVATLSGGDAPLVQ